MAKGKPRRANGTGTVYKLKGNRARPWVAQVPGPPKKTTNKLGKVVSRRTWFALGYYKTKTEAEKALAINMVSPVSEKHRISLEDLFEEWKSGHFQRIGSQSHRLYDCAYKQLESLHHRVFADIRTAHYQLVFDSLQRSLSYKKSIKTLLNLLYKYAMENDICHKNYAQFIKLDRSGKKDVVIFSDAELNKLFKNTEIPGVDMILMLIYSGFRIQEFLNLTVFDVHLDENYIVGGLKTESGTNRFVPIHKKTRKFWEKYVAAASDRLFVHNRRPLSQEAFRTIYFYPALDELGIQHNEPRKSPHTCRDTCATLLARDGSDILAIQQILGHKNYAFTANVYTAKDVNYLIENMNKIK